MSQPLDIISGALLDIGAREAGEPVGPDDANEAFTLLNLMMDQWSNESLMVISISEVIQTIGGGGTDWTIGPSGQINVVRPLRINSAFVRVSSIDYPVAVIDVNQYELIGLKQLAGPWPRAVYYNSGSPLGLLKFWPNPSSGEIHLFVDQIFSQFATINDSIQFPPGYEYAMRRNLALELMPSYGKASPVQITMIKKSAAQAKGNIKSTNMDPQYVANFDRSISMGQRVDAGFILSGGF